MRTLVTADLHLTDRENDAYRWQFLHEWLWDQQFNALVILGDLTEEKDNHSSTLVNRVVAELIAFAREGIGIHVLMGNHDYAEEANPFFRFLSEYPNCYYYAEQKIVEIGNARWAFLPHARKPDWGIVDRFKSVGVDFVCCHQVFAGAVSESGHKMLGCSWDGLVNGYKLLAGDIHVPQRVGPVEYVGAPYPIRFGDSYKPRVMVVADGKCRNLYPPSIQKLVLRITDPDQIEYQPSWRVGDQVKVELMMRRRDFSLWAKYQKKIKAVCKRNDLVLCGIELKERKRACLSEEKSVTIPTSPSQQFDGFVKYANVDPSDVEVGNSLL